MDWAKTRGGWCRRRLAVKSSRWDGSLPTASTHARITHLGLRNWIGPGTATWTWLGAADRHGFLSKVHAMHPGPKPPIFFQHKRNNLPLPPASRIAPRPSLFSLHLIWPASSTFLVSPRRPRHRPNPHPQIPIHLARKHPSFLHFFSACWSGRVCDEVDETLRKLQQAWCARST